VKHVFPQQVAPRVYQAIAWILQANVIQSARPTNMLPRCMDAHHARGVVQTATDPTLINVLLVTRPWFYIWESATQPALFRPILVEVNVCPVRHNV
jgi:hypothetical protein